MVSSKSGILRRCKLAMDRRAEMDRVAGMKLNKPKVILEGSKRKGWFLTLDGSFLWAGNRVACKQYANQYCLDMEVPSWFNRKEDGSLHEVPVKTTFFA